MKNFLAALLLASLFALPSLAGAFLDTMNAEYVVAPADKVVPVKTPETIIERHFVQKLVKEPKAKREIGWATGFNGDLPSLTNKGADCEIEIGASSVNDLANLIIKGAATIYTTDNKYTEIKCGLSLFSGAKTQAGLFVGLEQYLTSSVSIGADIYPIITGNNSTTIGQAFITGRVYF